MPLKIPPFTPVNIQPTSAEPFSTFVNSTPLATTPLTGTELVPIIQRGVSSHTTPSAIAPPFAHRTILTANTNYYVTTTGSDSNDGLTLGTAWATVQHGTLFVAENLDFNGFSVTINIGSGTFAGFGLASTTGGGQLIIGGAGSGSTIITAGPNDGTFNFGECIDSAYPTTCAYVFTGGFKLVPTLGPAVAAYSIPNLNFSAAPLDLALDISNIASGTVVFLGGSISLVNSSGSPATCNVTLGASSATPANMFMCSGLFTFAILGIAFVFTGAIPFNAFIDAEIDALMEIDTDTVSFTGGTITGVRARAINCSAITGLSSAAPMSDTFFPGNQSIIIDASSYYGAPTTIPGPLPGVDTQTGASYVLVLSDTLKIVEMNNAGANTLTVPTNASVPFNIGTKIWVTQIGAGATTIAGAGGVTVDNAGVVGGQWKSVKLYKRGTDEWVQTNA